MLEFLRNSNQISSIMHFNNWRLSPIPSPSQLPPTQKVPVASRLCRYGTDSVLYSARFIISRVHLIFSRARLYISSAQHIIWNMAQHILSELSTIAMKSSTLNNKSVDQSRSLNARTNMWPKYTTVETGMGFYSKNKKKPQTTTTTTTTTMSAVIRRYQPTFYTSFGFLELVLSVSF